MGNNNSSAHNAGKMSATRSAHAGFKQACVCDRLSTDLMGQCYSCNGKNLTNNAYPSDPAMSSPGSRTHGNKPAQRGSGRLAFGLRKSASSHYPAQESMLPNGGKNGNEQRKNEENRSALSTINDNQRHQTTSKPDSGSRFGFGFKRAGKTTNGHHTATAPQPQAPSQDSNKNPVLASSESLLSSDVTNSPSNRPGKATPYNLTDLDSDIESSRRPMSFSYTPRGGDHWKMIDDTSTADSLSIRSKSVKSVRGVKSEERLDTAQPKNGTPNGSSATLTDSGQHEGSKSKKSSSSHRMPGFGSRLGSNSANRLSSKTTNDNWIRAGPVNTGSTDNINTSQHKNPKLETRTQSECTQHSSMGTRAKNWFMRRRAKSDSNHNIEPVKGKHPDEVDYKNGNVTIENPPKSSQTQETISNSASLNINTKTLDDIDGIEPLLSKQSAAEESSSVMHKSISMSTPEDDTTIEHSTKDSGIGMEIPALTHIHPPLAMIESIDTSSIGSLNSDDLMLDTEDIYLDDDQYEHDTLFCDTSAVALPVEEAGQEHHVGAMASTRRQLYSTTGRSASTGNPSGNPGPMQRSSIPEEQPMKELSSLLLGDAAAPRRSAKLRKATRPSSFPGPTRHYNAPHYQSDSTPDTPQDSSQLAANGFPASGRSRGRSLRPPRRRTSSMNEEDVHIDGGTYRQLMQDITDYKTLLLKLKRVIQEDELGTPFGLKNGYRLSGGSQPTSPYKEEAVFSFPDNSKDVPDVQQVLQENAELQEKVKEMQNTINLLQQQMTKYEGGYTAKDGTKFTNAAVQTEKRVPITKQSTKAATQTSSATAITKMPSALKLPHTSSTSNVKKPGGTATTKPATNKLPVSSSGRSVSSTAGATATSNSSIPGARRPQTGIARVPGAPKVIPGASKAASVAPRGSGLQIRGPAASLIRKQGSNIALGNKSASSTTTGASHATSRYKANHISAADTDEAVSAEVNEVDQEVLHVHEVDKSDRPSRRTTPNRQTASTHANITRHAWADMQPKRSSSLPTNSRVKLSDNRPPLSRSLAVDKGLDMTRAHSTSMVNDTIDDSSTSVQSRNQHNHELLHGGQDTVQKTRHGVVLTCHLTSQIDISSASSSENVEHSKPVIKDTEQATFKEPYLRTRMQPAIRSRSSSSIVTRSRSKSPAMLHNGYRTPIINGRKLSASQSALSTAVEDTPSYSGLLTTENLVSRRSLDSRSPTNSREGSESSDKENRSSYVASKLPQYGANKLARTSSLKQVGVKKSSKNTVHFKTTA